VLHESLQKERLPGSFICLDKQLGNLGIIRNNVVLAGYRVGPLIPTAARLLLEVVVEAGAPLRENVLLGQLDRLRPWILVRAGDKIAQKYVKLASRVQVER